MSIFEDDLSCDVKDILYHCREILYFDPKERLETEGLPVKVRSFPYSLLATVDFCLNGAYP